MCPIYPSMSLSNHNTIASKFQMMYIHKQQAAHRAFSRRVTGGALSRRGLLLFAAEAAAVVLLLSFVSFVPAAVATPTVVVDTTTNRPIRIGVVGSMVGDIGGMLLASLDGVAVAVSEAGPIAGRTVEIVRGNTYDEEANVGPIIDGFMADPATELDVLAFTPGRMHIDASIPALERHNLTLVCPVSGDRQDYVAFNKRLALFTPVPDAEVEALLRFLVLERHLKRIAVVITEGFPLGHDLLPYINRVLDGFGLEIVCIFTLGWKPEAPGTGPQQLAAALAKGLRIQALINIAALYPLTGSFLAQFLMTYPDAYIGSAGLVVAVVLQTLQQLASFNIAAAEDRLFSTMFGSLPTAAIRFRGTSAPLSLSTAT